VFDAVGDAFVKAPPEAPRRRTDEQSAWLAANLSRVPLAVTAQRLGDLLATIDGRTGPLIGGRLVLWRLRKRARRWMREQSAVRWDPRGRQS